VATTARTAEQIRQDVVAELAGEPRVQPNEIGVSVSDGVVTLTGAVDSFTKRWAAEAAAYRVRGVRAVADDVRVRLPGSSERTDAEIAESAARALEWGAFVSPERVQVAVSKGRVTLSGEVAYAFQRDDAGRVVGRLTGVRAVTNLVTVRPPVFSPSGLRRAIEDALVRKPELDAQRIAVDVEGGRVILRGTVRSRAEKQEAERVARSTPGVTAVENGVAVRP
jgi:osmotically-inducible protein OsmY